MLLLHSSIIIVYCSVPFVHCACWLRWGCFAVWFINTGLSLTPMLELLSCEPRAYAGLSPGTICSSFWIKASRNDEEKYKKMLCLPNGKTLNKLEGGREREREREGERVRKSLNKLAEQLYSR